MQYIYITAVELGDIEQINCLELIVDEVEFLPIKQTM